MIRRSWVTVLIASVALVALVLGAGLAPARRMPPPTAFTLQCWHWGAARTPPPEELAALATLPITDLCWWCGSVTLEGGAPRFHVRGGRPAGWAGRPAWAVVRVEPSCAHLLDEERAAVRAAIAQGLARARAGGPLSGLQIDWDVPTRRLAAYAALLRELRRDLPAGCGLSCTGLVAWLDAAEVDAVAAAVDWWVPQCYSTDVPERADPAQPLVCRVPPGAIAARCAQLARPFRIGLPTFEQASLWSGDGRLIAAALPIACEDAIAAGLTVVGASGVAESGGERVLRFTAPRATVIAGRSIPAGASLVIGEPTVASLGAQIAAVRAQGGPWCGGVSLFRLPSPGELPCLTAAQVGAAWRGVATVPVADVTWTWSGGSGGGWTLAIANRGLADWVDFGAPVRLAVGATPVPGAVPAAVTVLPAVDGVPSGPEHATGVLLVVPFLRAGAMVELAFPTQAAAPTCVALPGKDPA